MMKKEGKVKVTDPSKGKKVWVSETGEDIVFDLRSKRVTMIGNQIVVDIDEEVYLRILQHRDVDSRTCEEEIQGYIDEGSICFIVK